MELQSLSSVVSQAIQDKLLQHKEQEQQQIDALLASQKHLTSNLRTLINGLDQILQLSTPKYSNTQGDLIRSMAARSQQLQKQLSIISGRMQRIQEHLQQQQQQRQQEPGPQQQSDHHQPKQQRQQQQQQESPELQQLQQKQDAFPAAQQEEAG